MTSRERVLKALKFDNPDKVPADVWVLPIAMEVYGDNAVKDLRQKFPMDLNHDWNDPSGEKYSKGVIVDGWGVKYEVTMEGQAAAIVDSPIKKWSDLKNYKAPDIDRNALVKRAGNRCNNKETFNMCECGSLFQTCQAIRGMENFLIDIYEEEQEFYELLQIVHKYNLEVIEQLCKTDLDGVFFADDWGTQTALLINPSLWVKIFKPLYKEYVDIAHKAGKFFFLHSDGYIIDIIEHLIDIGVDALNLQIFCMDIEEIGRRFKGRITFWGEIDRQHILNSENPEDSRDAVRKVKKHLYDERGGIIAQCEFGGEVKIENVEAVYDEWSLK